MVNVHVIVNQLTRQLVNLLPSPRRGVGGEAPRQLVNLKLFSFFDKRNSQNRKNGGAFDVLSHQRAHMGFAFSAC